MDFLIEANEIAGNVVYGVQQYDYTVDGLSHQDYIAALIAASFRESVAIEDTTTAYADVVKVRERKVDELGEVLAVLAKAIAQMDTSNNNPDAESGDIPELVQAKDTCGKYGLTLTIKQKDGKTTITYRNATTAQNDIEYALDTEDNNMQQDMVSLESLISKRDNAYSTASQVVEKATGTADSIISNMAD